MRKFFFVIQILFTDFFLLRKLFFLETSALLSVSVFIAFLVTPVIGISNNRVRVFRSSFDLLSLQEHFDFFLVSSFASLGARSVSIVQICGNIEYHREVSCTYLPTKRKCVLQFLGSFELGLRALVRGGNRSSWCTQQPVAQSCLGTFSDTYFPNRHSSLEHYFLPFCSGVTLVLIESLPEVLPKYGI